MKSVDRSPEAKASPHHVDGCALQYPYPLLAVQTVIIARTKKHIHRDGAEIVPYHRNALSLFIVNESNVYSHFSSPIPRDSSCAPLVELLTFIIQSRTSITHLLRHIV